MMFTTLSTKVAGMKAKVLAGAAVAGCIDDGRKGSGMKAKVLAGAAVAWLH